MRRFISLIGQFSRNDRGSITIIYGVSFLVLCLAMGLAYDFSRLNNVTTRVQAALDAAALAGAKLLDDDTSSDSAVVQRANALFNAHRAEIGMNGLQMGSMNATLDRVQSTVRVSVNGSISSLFGSLAQISPTLNFTRTSETTYKTRKVEMSLVVDITGSMLAGGKIDSLKTAAKDLVDTLFATNPNPGAIRVALVPYSASVNAGGYYNAVIDPIAPAGADSCVVERSGSANATDAAPGAGRYLGTSSPVANPRYSCPPSTVSPLADLWDPGQRTAFKNRIDALTPTGATAGHIGLAWGWYFLSQDWASLWPADQRPKPASPDITKAIILMTDGEFNTSYLPANTNSTDFSAADSSGAQALALCNKIKQPGSDIIIYTIGFQAPINAENMLRSCSGTNNFFDVSSAGDLIAAFREIAERLNSLRISS